MPGVLSGVGGERLSHDEIPRPVKFLPDLAELVELARERSHVSVVVCLTVLAEPLPNALSNASPMVVIVTCGYPTGAAATGAHFGDMAGVRTLNAVTSDGHRSAVFYVATALADPDQGPALMKRELTLLDDLSCG